VKGKCEADDDAKRDTMLRMWVPAVNAAGRFGRWDFIWLDGPYQLAAAVDDYLARRTKPVAA
jgi:type III restriction enzyme